MGGLSASQMKATRRTAVFLEAMSAAGLPRAGRTAPPCAAAALLTRSPSAACRWHVSVLDIERTLTVVTQKVRKDHAATAEKCKKRMEGIGVAAEVFMAEAVAAGGSKDPRQGGRDGQHGHAARAAAGDAAAEAAAGADGAAGGAGGAGGAGAGGAGGGGGSGGGAGVDAAKQYSLEELRAMPVRELKQRARARRRDDAVEKEEFVQPLFVLQQGRRRRRVILLSLRGRLPPPPPRPGPRLRGRS